MGTQESKGFRVLCQKWEESERGWGTRPDGYSLHLSEADRKQYIGKYWAKQPNEVPDEYSRPCGTAYWCLIKDKKTYDEIVQSKYGIREFKNSYPGSGGTDGWVSLERECRTKTDPLKEVGDIGSDGWKPFGTSSDGWTPF